MLYDPYASVLYRVYRMLSNAPGAQDVQDFDI